MGAVLGKISCECFIIAGGAQTYRTDSANVLWWIRGYSHTFKPFIANRVGEIHLSSSPNQWRHVPTAMNPADHLTRGFKIEELVNLKMWWEGPEFLKQDELTWPKNVVDKKPSDALREVKIKYMERSEDTCTMLSRSERIDPKIDDKKKM